ncbi:hypothetical protein ACFQY0_20395 [Haloferula chungangensis]|uniref:Uncharacterized protein n=1 Tax=Haloferula chungangensis TaxID=1048331 RepID=A0ABW2LCZ6_9BACT
MTTFRQKLHPHVLIPWVFALVALFGCNVLAQQKASLRKSAHLDGGSVTQLANDTNPSSTPTTPLLGLTGNANHGSNLTVPAGLRLAIGPLISRIETIRRSGAVQGRAPPAPANC